MREPYLSWPEAAWLIMQYSVCANYLFMPQLLYSISGRLSWAVPIIAIPPAMVGVWAVYHLHTRFPEERLGQFLPRLVGRPLAFAIGGLYILFWLGGALANVTVFAHYLSDTKLQFTPVTVLVATNVLVIVLVSLSGLKTLVRVNDALIFIVAPFLLISWLWPFFASKLDFSNLAPVRLSELTADPLRLVGTAMSMYHGHLITFITGPALNPPGRSALTAGVAGTLASVLTFLIFTSMPLIAFGWPYANLLTYPAASFLEVVAPKTGLFPIRRFDFVLTVFFRYIMIVAAMSYFYSCAQTLSDLVSPSARRMHPALVVGLGITLVVLSGTFKGIRTVMEFASMWVILGAAAAVMTLILALVAFLRSDAASGR
ncbi:MAG TPA: hypothetical protein DCL63_07920 [Firmicutes bacterium]|jgi:hypothetical protein|nr:hypothetical protein [Bacillota bacterium]